MVVKAWMAYLTLVTLTIACFVIPLMGAVIVTATSIFALVRMVLGRVHPLEEFEIR